eukprot:TRINITY_DN20639_c0_g1_i3.p1 TRINITY_DN20639_c0_g1~~TRINITY_DN20639_c0_g1_i3.p1  ORF type:complete len:287 (-),score=3.29 TRINITY_DN20639_c0_g1_i3:11-871(-)
MRTHRHVPLLVLLSTVGLLLAPLVASRSLTPGEKERLDEGSVAVAASIDVKLAGNSQTSSIPQTLIGALLRRGKGGGQKNRPKLSTDTNPGLMLPLTGAIPTYAPQSIAYKNGPVMWQPLEVYLIWHGTWIDGQKEAVRNFVASIGEETLANVPASVKDWWNTNRLYKAGSTYVTPDVSLSNTAINIPAASSAAGQPPLKRVDITNLIRFQLLSGALPRLQNAIYAVFTSADVDVDGYCSDFCAYHDIAEGSWKYTWVGYPEKCLGKCTHEAVSGMDYPNAQESEQ